MAKKTIVFVGQARIPLVEVSKVLRNHFPSSDYTTVFCWSYDGFKQKAQRDALLRRSTVAIIWGPMPHSGAGRLDLRRDTDWVQLHLPTQGEENNEITNKIVTTPCETHSGELKITRTSLLRACQKTKACLEA